MEKDQRSSRDPLNMQESRKERRARLVRRRRRTALGILIAVVVLAGGGYAGYTFATRDGGASAATTEATNPGGSPGTASQDPAGAGSTTTVFSPNLAPQPLEVTADPEVTNLTITLQDGTTLTGKTPFSADVPGGTIQISLTKKGYNEAVRPLALTEPSTVKIWLDPSGQLVQSVTRFKCGPGPQQVAFSPDGRELWVALINGDGLEVYSPTTGAKTGQVSLEGEGTADLVFSSDGATLYAVNMRTNTVYEVDRVSRTVKRRFAVAGETPKAIALSPDGTTLFTANWDTGDVSQIDLASGKLVRRLPTVKNPRGVYVTSDGRRLYVAGYAEGELQRLDLSSGEGTLVFKSGGSLWAMAGDPLDGVLYVDDNALSTVFAMDLNTEVTTKLTNADSRPNTVRSAAGGRLLCVANRGKEDPANSAHAGPEWGSILLIDTKGRTVLDAIVGGNQCTALAISADGTLLAFSDFLDNRIRVYRVPPYEALAAGTGGRAIERFSDIVKK